MPRDGSQVYSVPVGTDGVPNTTILSAKYNTFIHDVETDLNTPRPVVAGGTAATSVNGALANLSAEKAAQLVTNWDSTLWMPGSFYAATTATGTAPVAAHAFSGIAIINEPLVNPPTNLNVVLEARDLTDPAHMVYYRIMTAGVWGAWLTARQSIYAAPFDALAYNGMQINGSIDVSQELGTAGISGLINVSKYIADGWVLNTAGPQVISSAQYGITSLPGYPCALGMSVATANAAPAAGNYCLFQQSIEGCRISRLAWGTASAQPITIGFWIYCNRPGTYSGSIRNNAGNRSYIFSFVVNAGATWEYKVITISGDTTGTWTTATGIGLTFCLALMAGSTFTTAPNTWTAGNFVAATGTMNGVAATTDNAFVTGFVVLPGIEAPSATRAPLIMRPFDQELAICRRYYWKSIAQGSVVGTGAGVTGAISYIIIAAGATYNGVHVRFPVSMRSTPTLTSYNPVSVNSLWWNQNRSADSGTFSGNNLSTEGFIAVNNPQAGADATSQTASIHVAADARL